MMQFLSQRPRARFNDMDSRRCVRRAPRHVAEYGGGARRPARRGVPVGASALCGAALAFVVFSGVAHATPPFAAVAGVAPVGGAPAGPPFERTETRASCARYDTLRRPHFGDLHVHTAFSLDASTQGTRNMPADAYRFARGEALGIQPYDDDGRPVRGLRLERPLDFAAVTDHAELFGELTICDTPGLVGYDAPICAIYRRWPRLAFFLMNSRSTNSRAPVRYRFCGPDGGECLRAARTPWRAIQDAAEAAYDRSAACGFTTFVGYEWTGAPGSNNLHRNVIFRNAVVPALPVSYFEASTLRAFWARLRTACSEERPGCDVLTIPHNSNLSGGLMFRTVDEDERPITTDDARLRAAFEPLVEVVQHKGDSECRLGPETEDELCGFEKLPYGNFSQVYLPWTAAPAEATSFVRRALKDGLVAHERLGANPFKFGLVGSTDTHLGAAGAVDEEDFPGHGGAGAVAAREMPPGLPDHIELNPGGLAVLWAEENSRDALFAAMRRREAYATSGPRIVVRVFGGWDLPDDLCERTDFVAQGYQAGVPMGADLPRPSVTAARAPRLAIWALRDPGTVARPGTALQRIQVVKGWVREGIAQERVYDVAGDPENGASVDLATCAPRGTGFDDLCTVWTDPDSDADTPAFYYVRVLENPTCRWSTRVCNANRVDCGDPRSVTAGFEPCCDPTQAKTIQERAYTSPIWYTPLRLAHREGTEAKLPESGDGAVDGNP